MPDRSPPLAPACIPICSIFSRPRYRCRLLSRVPRLASRTGPAFRLVRLAVPYPLLSFLLSLPPSHLPKQPRHPAMDLDELELETWCPVCDKLIPQQAAASYSDASTSSSAAGGASTNPTESRAKRPPSKFIIPMAPTFKRGKTGTIKVRSWRAREREGGRSSGCCQGRWLDQRRVLTRSCLLLLSRFPLSYPPTLLSFSRPPSPALSHRFFSAACTIHSPSSRQQQQQQQRRQ